MPSKWLTIGLPVFLAVTAVTLAIVLPIVLKPKKYACDATGACVQSSTTGSYSTSNCNNQCTKPTVQMYGCDATGTCVKDDNGPYNTSDCNNQCTKPPPTVQMYGCDTTGTCVKDDNGPYNTMNCNNQCTKPPPTVQMYGCDATGTCVKDDNGPYNTSNCNNQCTKPPPTVQMYGCDATGTCVKDDNGPYNTSNCNNQCTKPPPTVQMYGCDATGTCVKSSTGTYKTSNCGSQCVIPPIPINNPVLQVAVMDYNQQQSDLNKLVPFVQKYLPNKILWKITGPYCATASATMSQHIASMVSICAYYKTQGLPYPNVALYPDLTDTACYNASGADKQDALTLYPIVAAYHKQWLAAVQSGNNVPADVVPFLCNELVLEQEGVVNGGDPDAFAACRAALPSTVALSCNVSFTELTSGSGPLIKNSIIGDNSFRPGFVYLEMYNMYTEKVPYQYDVTPSTNSAIAAICATNTCSPPLDQSIYAGASLLSPSAAAGRIIDIMNSFGKFVGFPGTCTVPCSLRNFVFVFSYEQATSGSGPLYLLGNTVDPWDYDKFSTFSTTFVSGVVDALKPVLPSVTSADVQVGVYNLQNALARWGV
jgi:hypothetical protein